MRQNIRNTKNYERVMCKDGFNFSVQAANWKYCSPRSDVGPYHEVEVGFPSQREELIMPWMEGSESSGADPTQSVYAWVPASTVMDVIRKHGGMTGGELPPLVQRRG